ncbi:hypothetical protein [Runella sp.]|uniref:hypothetical protein n=1 Tax=Runella sp. TaxID=1960881 RepID=UPI003D107357
MRNKQCFIGLLSLLLLTVTEVTAQHFPVQATFYSRPPYPVRLVDYANPQGKNLSLKVVLRDLNLGPTQVYFKFRISSNSVSYGNPQTPSGTPIFTLTPGVVQTFTQADFARNFTRENLNVSPFLYPLPLQEGIYTFSVEIIDVLTNRALSKVEQMPPVWLVVNDPPILNVPQNLSQIKVQNPQNLIFQWTPRHRQAATVEYEFVLTELLIPDNFNGNPQNLFLSQPPYYQATTSSTSLLFGPAQPPLIAGRTYGFRVRAKAKQGFEEVGIFRNDGYSEIFVFNYGEKNRAPIILSAKWGNDAKPVITWKGMDRHTQFEVLYKRTSDTQEASFPFFSLSNPYLQKTGDNTYVGKINAAREFKSGYTFRVGGITGVSGEETLFSGPIVLPPIDWSKITVSGIFSDSEDYLALLAGKSRKDNPNPLAATCPNPRVNPTDTKTNAVVLGDTVHAGGTDVVVMSDEYAHALIKTPGGSTIVKLYYSADFKINQYNELISGYLTGEVTNQRIKLLSSGGDIGETDITNKQLISLGVRTDSLKILANQIHDQSKQQLAYTTANRYISRISAALPALSGLLTAKQALILESIKVINEELAKNLPNQQRTHLQNMKTKLTAKSSETQKNIDNLNTFIQNFRGLNFTNDIMGLLLPQLFL